MSDRPEHVILLQFVCCILFSPNLALAQAAPAVGSIDQSHTTVGTLRMPLISPEQATQMLSSRVAPNSDVPEIVPVAASVTPPQALNVDPILGHDLPTDAVSSSGFPRADFAIAKPGAGNKASALGVSVGASSRPRTTVLPEQPPAVGKP